MYLLMMGLMACVCLTTQSCAQADDDDINYNAPSYDSSLGMPGEFHGYWIVCDTRTDSCVMRYDGQVFSFSKLPIETILDYFGFYIRSGYFPQGCIGLDGSQFLNYQDKNATGSEKAQIEAGPMVVLPTVVGYSESNLYFNTSIQVYENAVEENYSNMYYSFCTKVGDKTTSYRFLFDKETYGVYNWEQKSRVIKFNIKEISIITPGQRENNVTLSPMMELIFVSKN